LRAEGSAGRGVGGFSCRAIRCSAGYAVVSGGLDAYTVTCGFWSVVSVEDPRGASTLIAGYGSCARHFRGAAGIVPAAHSPGTPVGPAQGGQAAVEFGDVDSFLEKPARRELGRPGFLQPEPHVTSSNASETEDALVRFNVIDFSSQGVSGPPLRSFRGTPMGASLPHRPASYGGALAAGPLASSLIARPSACLPHRAGFSTAGQGAEDSGLRRAVLVGHDLQMLPSFVLIGCGRDIDYGLGAGTGAVPGHAGLMGPAVPEVLNSSAQDAGRRSVGQTYCPRLPSTRGPTLLPEPVAQHPL